MAYNTIKLRGGLEVNRSGETPAARELLLTTDENKLYAGDGSSAGGTEVTVTQVAKNGDVKLEATATGVDVTGTVTADGLVVDNNGSIVFNDPQATDTVLIGTNDNELILRTDDGDITLKTNENKQQLRVSNNGDISFYEDTGTTAKFFWDASAESLGIGTTSPDATLHIGHPLQTSGSYENKGLIITESGQTEGLVAFSRSPVECYIGLNRDTSASSGYFVLGMNLDSAVNKVHAITIRENGNVGIGTTLPNFALDVTSGIGITEGNALVWHDGSGGRAFDMYASGADNSLRFRLAGSSEAMRIDSSGNLLVGKTSASGSTVGAEMRAAGTVIATVNNDYPLYLNRLTSDGDIAVFAKNGAPVGSIGTGSGYLTVGSGDTGLLFNDDTNRIQPWNLTGNTSADAAIDIGLSSQRFKDLYLSGGVYLGGTGAANKLDDYEEGTQDPTTVTPATSGTITLNTSYNLLEYTKTGRLATVTGHIRISSVSSPVGGTYRIGLPFTVASGDHTGNNSSVSLTKYDSSTATWSVVPATLSEGTTYVIAREDASVLGASDQFYITATFNVA